MRPSVLFFAILIAGDSSAAFAECSLVEFGHHKQPPLVLRPHPVDNTYAQFSYGSDVWTNPETGGYEAWNFIKNDDMQKSLAVDWAKAGIHYNIGNTLLPNQLACNYNSLAEPSDNPDFTKYIDKNASIIYSSSNQEQKAWIYAEPTSESKDPGSNSGGGSGPPGSESGKKIEGWLKHAFSRFVTTATLENENKQEIRYDVDVSIDSAYSGHKLQIHVKTEPQDLTIGIARLYEFLGNDNTELISEQFQKQGYLVNNKLAYEVMGYDVAKELLSEREVKTKILLLSGQKGGTADVPISPDARLVRQPSIVVIFDRNGHPIAADGIRLFQLTLQ